MHQKAIIAASVVLGFGFISIMVFITRFFWVHGSAKDNTDSRIQHSVDPNEQHFSLFSSDGSWVRILKSKRDRGQWVPTLSGIIKAGDEGVYSSALFNGMHGHAGELSLEMLYDAFANELRTRPMSERSAYPPAISKFLSTTRQQVRRDQSLRTTKDGRTESPPKPQRYSLDLAERGLSRSRSRKLSPVLTSTFNALPSSEPSGTLTTARSWVHELQHAQYLEGRLGISVTPAELTALSVILGSSPMLVPDTKAHGKPDQFIPVNGQGAFGISISVSPMEDGKHHIVLKQHKRGISQLPARGSGYSTLVAKHIAFGSLPFSQDKNAVSTMLITNETFEAIRAGTCLHLQRSDALTAASKLLASLPSSRDSNFHTLTLSNRSTSTPLLPHTIAALPFTGGLVPLASTPLVKTVRFVASAGLPPARLLQRLEALVDKVHRHSPSLQLFGPLFEASNAGLLFRERERLGKLATGGVTEDTIADKTARMHRYMTLLERLMCLVPDTKPHDVLAAVQEATKKEMERSYEDAVATFKHSDIDAANDMQATHKRHSSLSTRSRRSKRSSALPITMPRPVSTSTIPTSPTSPTDITSPRHSSTFPTHNLGRQVEQILKVDLPFNVETIALVARMVIVAWTLSVESVAGEEGDEGIRLGGLERFPERMSLW